MLPFWMESVEVEWSGDCLGGTVALCWGFGVDHLHSMQLEE